MSTDAYTNGFLFIFIISTNNKGRTRCSSKAKSSAGEIYWNAINLEKNKCIEWAVPLTWNENVVNTSSIVLMTATTVSCCGHCHRVTEHCYNLIHLIFIPRCTGIIFLCFCLIEKHMGPFWWWIHLKCSIALGLISEHFHSSSENWITIREKSLVRSLHPAHKNATCILSSFLSSSHCSCSFRKSRMRHAVAASIISLFLLSVICSLIALSVQGRVCSVLVSSLTCDATQD